MTGPRETGTGTSKTRSQSPFLADLPIYFRPTPWAQARDSGSNGKESVEL